MDSNRTEPDNGCSPLKNGFYCDFYIPKGKVYVENWGIENHPKYLDRKIKKLEIYKKYWFNLIEYHDKELHNLDDILPRMLLKLGVQFNFYKQRLKQNITIMEISDM